MRLHRKRHPSGKNVIAAAASEPEANERGSSLISRRLHYRGLFCFFIYSDLFSYQIYSLSKKELKGKTKFAILSHPGCNDCKAGHGKCSFFVLKSLHGEHTPFQAAQIQKEHCPHRNHATHLCHDHALFEVIGGFRGGAERAAVPPFFLQFRNIFETLTLLYSCMF